MSRRRYRATFRKELREYRHNANIIYAMAFIPIVFVIAPLIQVFAAPTSAAGTLRQTNILVYLLGIPTLVPALVASYAVVGERDQGTLEPLLATPVRREEFLLGKALAALVPSLVVSYSVFGLFVACVELFAHPGVASALIRGPEVLAQVLFTPLLAAWSIWVGMAVSVRSRDVRVAGQISALASLPVVGLTSAIAFNGIKPTLALALGLGATLLAVDVVGWRVIAVAMSPERLIIR